MKKVLAVLITVTLVLVLSGCGLTGSTTCTVCEVCPVYDQYRIEEVKIIEVNEGVYLTQTTGFQPKQYVLVTLNVFEEGNITNIAIYDDGIVRMWNELKEFD